MVNRTKPILITLSLLFLFLISCTTKKEKREEKDNTMEKVNICLFDKELDEIKKSINGKWELITGKNNTVELFFENTIIEFNNNRFVWIEDGETEKGELNWRKGDTGNGYESYLMDLFSEDSPAYPLGIRNDTLTLQECNEYFRYKLVRVK